MAGPLHFRIDWIRPVIQAAKLFQANQTRTMQRLHALTLLAECTGRDIWSVEYCQSKRIPDLWIEELTKGYESGFRSNRQTIYEDGKVVNQYEGIHDVELAIRLAEFLGVETERLTSTIPEPVELVRLLKEAVDE